MCNVIYKQIFTVCIGDDTEILLYISGRNHEVSIELMPTSRYYFFVIVTNQ